MRDLVEGQSSHPEAFAALKANEAQFFERYVGALLQQLAEKIDKTREVAGRNLQIFFKFVAPSVCSFAEKDALAGLFTQETPQLHDGATQSLCLSTFSHSSTQNTTLLES
jgi:hypothetical protein